MKFEILTKEKHKDELQGFIQNNYRYFEFQEGRSLSGNEAEEIFDYPLPRGLGRRNRKIIGVYESKLIGVVDILYNYPSREAAMIGLIVVDNEHRNRGFGKRMFEKLLDEYINLKWIYIGVLEENFEAKKFWLKRGFELESRCGSYNNQKLIFMKREVVK